MRLLPGALVVCGLTACSGDILGGTSASAPSPNVESTAPTSPVVVPGTPDPAEPLPPVFDCQPGADPTPAAALRLTRRQYRATLSDLLSHALSPATVEGFLSQGDVAQAFAALPEDGSSDRLLVYDAQDQRISTRLVEPQLEVATAVGTWISADATRLATFVRTFAPASTCATVTASACVDAFIEGFGQRALRRPLDAADGDAAFYRAAYDDTTYGGYRGLIAAMLLSPGFTFRLELKGTAEAGRDDLSRLTPFELASRLSYTLTGSMPARRSSRRRGWASSGPGRRWTSRSTGSSPRRGRARTSRASTGSGCGSTAFPASTRQPPRRWACRTPTASARRCRPRSTCRASASTPSRSRSR
jgi:hypothetical protein